MLLGLRPPCCDQDSSSSRGVAVACVWEDRRAHCSDAPGMDSIARVFTVGNGCKAVRYDDETTVEINWTEYLLLVSPPQIHEYLVKDPQVAVPSTEYMKEVNQVLSETTPRTVTNYVMVQYILSWLPLLEKKYNDLLQWFGFSSVDLTTPRNRSEVCFSETKKHYPIAMFAMYARSRTTK
ncbi:hypothetical protein OSTOST_01897, partial [Ostertagia ostertagi]